MAIPTHHLTNARRGLGLEAPVWENLALTLKTRLRAPAASFAEKLKQQGEWRNSSSPVVVQVGMWEMG